MPGRNYQPATPYKYGFNGQLKDDEVYGAGNLNSAEFWEYDTRLGRRWNIDPVVKPWESSYACFSNNPVYYTDVTGQTASPPDKNLYDDETGEFIETQPDANGKDYVTDSYVHKGADGGWVQTDEVTPEQKQAVVDNAKKREEQLAPSKRISSALDNMPRDMVEAAPGATKVVAATVVVVSAAFGQPEGVAAGVTLYEYADNVDNAMTVTKAAIKIVNNDRIKDESQGWTNIAGVAADVTTGIILKKMKLDDKVLEGSGTISTDIINSKITENVAGPYDEKK